MRENSSEIVSSEMAFNADGEFYKLIPKGHMEEQPGKPVAQNMSESEQRRTFNEFRELEQKLQDCFDYQNSHTSELEQAYSIKPLFILNNGFPKNDAERAMMILVAERDVFFKDADDNYCSKCVNHDFLSERKSIARKFKQAADNEESMQNWMVESSLRMAFHLSGDALAEFDSRADVRLAREILLTVLHKAKSVYGWLYSNEHIKLSENNRAYYEQEYMTFPDGDIDTSRVFPENRDEQKRFIQALLNKGSPFQTGMLDMEVCKQDFQTLVPECKEHPLCSVEFYDKVILCLAEYISHERQIRYRFPEDNGYIDNERIFRNYGGFKVRYDQVRALEDAFLHTARSYPNLPKSIEIDWKTGKTGKEETARIVNAIEQYCRQEGIPVKWNTDRVDDHVFRSGIEWILNPPQQWDILKDDALKPIIILSFILSFRNHITQDSIIETIEIFSDCSKRTAKATQRFEQIKLLDTIHAALNLSWDLYEKSWNEYLFRRGKAIQSEEELLFWRSKLQGRYKLLPMIGFQLCFLDFCNDCMSPHPELLAYVSIRANYGPSFSDFYAQNLSAIRELADSLPEHPNPCVAEIIKRYQKLWKTQRAFGEEIRRTIRPLRELLQKDTSLFEMASSEDIIEFTIEVAIRLSFIMKAQDKLTEWFDKIYGCSLKKLNKRAFLSNNDDEDRKS